MIQRKNDYSRRISLYNDVPFARPPLFLICNSLI